jgi:hypothetical protein
MRGAWLVMLSLAGCRVTGHFQCEQSEQCVGQGAVVGVCVEGSCAFGDTGCSSGWRYDDSAAEDVAGECIGESAPADCASWSSKYFKPCGLPMPLGAMQISANGYIYDTDRGAFIGGPEINHSSIAFAQDDGTVARIMSVSSFTVDPGVRIRVLGSMPLIVASWGEITMAGRIELDSNAGGFRGAGSSSPKCAGALSGESGVASGGSGGGGGGGFGAAGGTGGTADVDNGAINGGTGGGAAMTPARYVRGGCSGAPGGAIGVTAMAPLTPASVAPGGAGGGALLLSARTTLTLTGSLDAGGAGGIGGPGNEAGGGGGGSGGFLGLEAPMVIITATGVAVANGGGGGAGATTLSTPAANGQDAGASPPAVPGGVVALGSCATAGGAGGAGAAPAGLSIDPARGLTCGGGGGGGAAGVLAIHSPNVTMTGAMVSPTPIVDPN